MINLTHAAAHRALFRCAHWNEGLEVLSALPIADTVRHRRGRHRARVLHLRRRGSGQEGSRDVIQGGLLGGSVQSLNDLGAKRVTVNSIVATPTVPEGIASRPGRW